METSGSSKFVKKKKSILQGFEHVASCLSLWIVGVVCLSYTVWMQIAYDKLGRRKTANSSEQLPRSPAP